MRQRRLEGRCCWIVGGTGGIGLASARRFLDEGAKVVVTGLSAGEADAAAAELASIGPAWANAGDVAAPGIAAAVCAEALDYLGGRLDVLFHVAGISGRRFGDGPLDECTEAGWDAVVNTNAKGLFLTNQAAVRRMLTQEPDAFGLRGSVLNMGTVLDEFPSPDLFGTYAYAASKGAVRAMTLSAAARYARVRVRFNLLAPGLIDTPMAARAVGDPTIRAYLAAKQPLAAGPGSADDVADAALFLCAPASRFVTGTVLTIDGGWHVSEGWPPHPDSGEAPR